MRGREFLGLDKNGEVNDNINYEDYENFSFSDSDDEQSDSGSDAPKFYQEIIRVAPSMRPKVVNIVEIARFNTQIDLEDVAIHARNSEYNPHRFKALILRIQEPKATALIFGKGSMNIIGTKTTADANLAMRKFAKSLQILKYPKLKITEDYVANMVATCSAGFQIDLSAFSRSPQFRDLCVYNTELFSGMTFKIILSNEKKMTLLIFRSGKIVLTGGKSMDDLHEAVSLVFPFLIQFQQQPPPLMAQTSPEQPNPN